jgi:1-phosphatidylinositol phosphodiesterase
MHIKEEWNPEGNTESFETTFLDYISPYPQYWALGNHIPTLGSVRGKIVLLRRFELNDPGTVLGIKALPWLDNQIFALNNEARLQIQDQYNVPTILNVVDKWNVIENCIYEAAANSDNILFVNFTSGASGGAYPYTIAKGYPGESGINKRLEDFLEANPQFRHCGIIYLNFPEYPQLTLLSTIYSLNSFKRKVIINEPHIPVIKKRQSRH